MKIEVDEKGGIVLSEVYSGHRFEVWIWRQSTGHIHRFKD